MIALDLCQPHYQVLLITYLKFTVKNVKMKTVNQNVILLDLKLIDYVTNVKNVKKIWSKPGNGLIKKIRNVYQFCKGNLNKFVLFLRKVVYPYEHMVS